MEGFIDRYVGSLPEFEEDAIGIRQDKDIAERRFDWQSARESIRVTLDFSGPTGVKVDVFVRDLYILY